MLNQDLVSVVIPVYNVEEFVERSVQSVLDQSYKNVEIILVEDGSTDESLSKCKSLCDKFSNIKLLVHEKNQGQEATRNDGIDAATGKWLLFLDSDDTLKLDCIEKLVDKAASNSCDIVLFDFVYNVNGTDNRVTSNLKEGLYSKQHFISYMLVETSLSFVSCIGTKFYNVSFLKNAKIKFDRKFKFNEDGAFGLTAINECTNIYYLKEPFYNYIIRQSGSVQSTYRNNFFDTVKNVHVMLRDMLVENKCSKKAMKQYYLISAQFILVCLKNEKDFKSYESFLEVFKKIKKDDEYLLLCKHILSIPSMKYRLFMIFYKFNLKKLVYRIV